MVNGFESMAGQINIEFLKPDEADKLILNAYANMNGKVDLKSIGIHVSLIR